jgi:hypothetical protein
LFGLAAVTLLLVCRDFEDRKPGFTLASPCAAASAGSFLQEASPVDPLEVI